MNTIIQLDGGTLEALGTRQDSATRETFPCWYATPATLDPCLATLTPGLGEYWIWVINERREGERRRKEYQEAVGLLA